MNDKRTNASSDGAPGFDNECTYDSKNIESYFVNATSPMMNLPGVGSTSFPLGNVPPQAAPGMPEIPFLPKPPPTMRDPFSYMESCVMKTITGAPVGWALGGAFGILMASWESMTPPVLMPGVPEPPGKPWKEEFRAAGRTMARKTASWSKNFAIVTAVYQGLECSLERTRAKHDIWNHGVAGCGTGTYESLP